VEEILIRLVSGLQSGSNSSYCMSSPLFCNDTLKAANIELSEIFYARSALNVVRFNIGFPAVECHRFIPPRSPRSTE